MISILEKDFYDTNNLLGEVNNIKDSLTYFLPQIVLTCSILALIVIFLVYRHHKKVLFILALTTSISLIAYGFLCLQQLLVLKKPLTQTLFMGSITISKLNIFGKLLITFISILTVLNTFSTNSLKKQIKGEYFITLLSLVLGLDLIIASNNLLVLYLSIELVSISSYILTAFDFTKKSAESSMKYILFGGMASGIMLYGMSFLYGLSNSLQIQEISSLFVSTENLLIINFATLLFFTGLFFKLSLYPFHFWTPDIYEGAPIAIVSFFSVAPKIAIFLVLYAFCQHQTKEIHYFLLIVVFITIIIGNFSALLQSNLKRLMAYSSIAQVGFISLMLFSKTDKSIHYALFYFIVYAIAVFGVFLIIEIIGKKVDESKKDCYDIKHYTNLAKQNTLLGICMLIFMIVLVGLPPTAGFIGKFLVLLSVWETFTLTGEWGLLCLILLAIFMTIVSLFYYLKVPFYIFFKKEEDIELPKIILNKREYITLLSLAFLSILLFFIPQILLGF